MALVSVVTIAKDHAQGLRKTYASLESQDNKDWQMLLVIAPSKDETFIVARDIAAQDSRVQVIEESTPGLYAAMNDGIKNCAGEFIWFMNAGDEFSGSHVLGSAIQTIVTSEVGVVTGGFRIDGGNSDQVFSYALKTMTALNFSFNRRSGCHQAMIFNSQAVREAGNYNTSYALASDFDLVLKVIKSSGGLRVPDVYASIEPGGVADQNLFQVHSEKHAARKEFFGKYSPVIVLSLLWTLAARVKIVLKKVFHEI